MNEEISNLYTLSKNKFSINLLETIEHKELFQNINKNINKTESKNNQHKNKTQKNNNNNKTVQNYDNSNNNFNKEYYIISEENSQNNEKYIQNEDVNNDNDKEGDDLYLNDDYTNFNKENSIKLIINKAKTSSKSFKDIVKKKLDNFQGIFIKLSPEKNKRCVTQDDARGNEKNNNIPKKNKKNKNYKNDIDIKDFSFERRNKNNNLFTEQNNNYYYSNPLNNDNENKNYFKTSKKNEPNISYYNHNDNNNLDVYNRLYNKSYYNKKKNNINTSEENNCTFNPQLLSNFKNKKNNDCLDNFIKRQEQFNKYIKQKKINLKNDINKIESKKYTFTPNTSCTSGSKYSIKLEAQRLEESNLDKANRLVYDSVKKMKEKNNNLFLMYNTQYSFIPTINKNINYKRNNSNNNKINNYINKSKKKDRNKIEEIKDKSNKTQYKYVNHQYDNITSNYKNDKELMNRIKEENKKRTKRLDNMRRDQENEDNECCTFKPDIQKNNTYYINKLNNIKYNYYNNKDSNRELSYVDYYNKKKGFKNKLNRSQSYNRNNWYINSNINYNNYNDSQYNNDNNNNNLKYNCYDNTDYEYDNYNDYNNSNINCNDCYNNNYLEYNNDINSKDNYNFNYSDNIENFGDYEKRRSYSNNCYNNKKDNYIYMTPKPNKMYSHDNKFRAIDEIKNEDKQNFLLIHKLLYEQ